MYTRTPVSASIELNSDWNLLANSLSISRFFSSINFLSFFLVRVYLHANFYRFLNNKPFLTVVRLGSSAAKGCVWQSIADPYREHMFKMDTKFIHILHCDACETVILIRATRLCEDNQRNQYPYRRWQSKIFVRGETGQKNLKLEQSNESSAK